MKEQGMESAFELFHQSLVQLAQQLQELQNTMIPKETKLHSYNQLPPVCLLHI